MKCPYCIKQCNKCGRLLVANAINFSKKKNRKYGVRAECKQCCKQYYKEYKQKKENKDKIKNRNKRYYNEHKEEILTHCKEYKKNNPDKIFNQNNNRRSLEENQGDGITNEQWLEMMQFFDWKCAYSGIEFSSHNEEKDRSIDHIIPLTKGGENEIWNCVPMKLNLNSSKNNNNMLNWYKQQEFYSEERLNKIYEWIKYAKDKWDKK